MALVGGGCNHSSNCGSRSSAFNDGPLALTDGTYFFCSRSFYASTFTMALVGGGWDGSSYCGSRSSLFTDNPSYLNTNVSARILCVYIIYLIIILHWK